jgi:hypothetical protein
MSRITQIRDVAASSKGNLTDALLQCLVLSDELEYPPLTEWVNLELSDYPDIDSMPDCRKAHSSLSGTLFEGNRYTTGYSIPDLWIDEEYRERALEVHIFDGISKLLTLPDDGSMGARSTFINCVEGRINKMLREKYGPLAGMSSVALPTPRGTYAAIIVAVQQRIVWFMIELNRIYPSDEEIEAETGERTPQIHRKFAQIVSIGSVHSLVMASSASEFNQTSSVSVIVGQGDFRGLANYLRALSVPDDAIQGLEPIAADLASDEVSEETKRFFTAWLNETVSEVPDVAGDVASEASKQALAAAILQGVARFAPHAMD